jgi:phosphoribosylanthranilate isomerase
VAESVTGAVETPLVKVCGLTRLEDVALAVALGAWAVGFVFAPSPRRVTAEQARPLVLAAQAAGRDAAPRGGPARPPLTVGVFVDSTAAEIAATVDAAGLDAVQLHGSEPGARAVRDALGDRAPHVMIIQVIPVQAGGSAAAELRVAVAAAGEAADLLLFDTRSEARFGGTGTAFPWTQAREAAGGRAFLVAGGIGPGNAREALAASGAIGIDVSSGVEDSPGVKDEGSLRALFAAVEIAAPLGAGGGPPAPLQASGGRAPRPAKIQGLPEGRRT